MTLSSKVLYEIKDLKEKSLCLSGVLVVVIAIAGCNGPNLPNLGTGAPVSSFGQLGAKLAGRSATQGLNAVTDSSMASSGTGMQGLYFGDLEIVAYNYRPGELLQSAWPGRSGTQAARDWSHWVLLQGGSAATRDLVLQPGQQLDNSVLQQGGQPIDSNFAAQVGQFSVDFLEVWIDSPGVVYSNTFYGQNNYFGNTGYSMSGEVPEGVSALYKYPTLTTFPFYFSPPQFAFFPVGNSSVNGILYGGALGEMSVIFARNDWFPTPVLVQANSPMACTICDGQPVTWSSSPLNGRQLAVLNSLISQGTQRRSYGNIIIVPNSLVVVGLNTSTVGTTISKSSAIGDDEMSPSENADNTPTVVVSPSQDALVEFDVANAINLSTSTFGQADFWHGSVINFATDPSGVPMGLHASFVNHGGDIPKP